mgnify:CR=1 FL=1
MEYVIDCTGWNKEQVWDIFSTLPEHTDAKIVLYLEGTKNVAENSKEKIVGGYLNKLGIPVHLKGHGYLKYGIVRCLYHSEELESVTKVLYPEIAKKYNTTAGRVEHGIRHAIHQAWENSKSEEWEKVFGKRYMNSNAKPTNSQFIASICDFISLNH